jgi:hypothetical protein
MRIQNFDFPGNFLFPLTTCLLCLFVLLMDLLRTNTLCILLLTIDNWPEKSKVSSLMASILPAVTFGAPQFWIVKSDERLFRTLARPHLSILTKQTDKDLIMRVPSSLYYYLYHLFSLLLESIIIIIIIRNRKRFFLWCENHLTYITVNQ